MTTMRSTQPAVGGRSVEAAYFNTYVNLPINDRVGRNGPRHLESSIVVLSGPDGDRYFDVPTGTTAQRPASPEVGYIRLNTDDDALEWWTGSGWAAPGDTGIVTYDNLDANGGVGTGVNQIAQGDHTH